MIVNTEVEKTKNENNTNLIKRFTRRVQESGVLQKVRSTRFQERTPSPLIKKNKKVKSLKKKTEIEKMIKLGKMPERRR